MKNLFKFLGIIALVVMIGSTMASCATNSNNTNGGQIASTKDSKKPMTKQEMDEWLQDAHKSYSTSILMGAGIATQVMKTPGLTAAAPNPNPSPYNIPIGSKALIKYATNRKEVIVTITDHISHNPPIIIDVSPETARALDLVAGGQVLVVYLQPKETPKDYDLVDSNLVIHDGVTTIGKLAFSDKQLTSVTIPNSVTSIGEGAFYKNQLTSITIPNSVTSIEGSAFRENQLTRVTIGNSVTSIGDRAFWGNQLTSVTIPNSVKSIGMYAFVENQLTRVTIGNSVTSIGNGAFGKNKLIDVTIPNNVTSIGDSAFRENQLVSVTIGNSVTSIGEGAFANNQLTRVTIGNNVTSIGEGAFWNNQLTSVTIPNSVISIGEYAFKENQLTSVTIPDSVRTLNDNVFSGAKNLTRISIGANVNITGTERLGFDFETYYLGNKRQAGTYTFTNGSWNFQPR